MSFRKFIENGKAKTAVYLPFQKYIQNYKQKKKANGYSPIKGKMQIISKIRASLPAEVVSGKLTSTAYAINNLSSLWNISTASFCRRPIGPKSHIYPRKG